MSKYSKSSNWAENINCYNLNYVHVSCLPFDSVRTCDVTSHNINMKWRAKMIPILLFLLDTFILNVGIRSVCVDTAIWVNFDLSSHLFAQSAVVTSDGSRLWMRWWHQNEKQWFHQWACRRATQHTPPSLSPPPPLSTSPLSRRDI